MSKLRCNSLQYGFSLRRHRWREDGTCERCEKTRNPLAGLKMFRPVKKKLDKSTSTEVLCAIGEGQ